MESTTKSKKKSTVMFEVSDTKEREYGVKWFSDTIKDFVSSLGFEIKSSGAGLFHEHEEVEIDGAKGFKILYDRTSWMGRQAFTREWKQRKERSIYITYGRGTLNPPTIATVKFNVEFPSESLVKKIKKAVEQELAHQKSLDDKQQYRQNQYEKFRQHYYANVMIAKHAECLRLEKGVILIYTKAGNIKISAETNAFIEFEPNVTEKMTHPDLVMWIDETKNKSEIVFDVLGHLGNIGLLDAEWIVFAKDEYGKTVSKKGVDKY